MESIGVLGFILSTIGIIALVRVEKLTKTQKEKGILDQNHKEE